MCLLCQEEDLYFLYLEQMEREARAARGGTAVTQANWMWPSFAKGDAAGDDAVVFAAPVTSGAAAQKSSQKSAFVCDDPDAE